MTEEVYQKRCWKCGIVKTVDLFGKDRGRGDGLNPKCKECCHLAAMSSRQCECGALISLRSKGRCRACCLLQRTETHKRCTKCCNFKPFNEFSKSTNSRDGLLGTCRECRAVKRNAARRKTVACPKCGRKRYICADGAWSNRLCRQCGSTKVRTLPIKYCQDCKKKITPYAKRCYRCRGQSRRGDQHYAWKGGISTATALERSRRPAQIWRKAVFHRDGYLCQLCHDRGTRSNPIHAHHKKGWAKCPELRYEVSNGITLCRDCHLYVAHQGAWANEGIEL